jgi:hypothetical protein
MTHMSLYLNLAQLQTVGSARYFYSLNTYSAILLQKNQFLYNSYFKVQHLTVIFR